MDWAGHSRTPPTHPSPPPTPTPTPRAHARTLWQQLALLPLGIVRAARQGLRVGRAVVVCAGKRTCARPHPVAASPHHTPTHLLLLRCALLLLLLRLHGGGGAASAHHGLERLQPALVSVRAPPAPTLLRLLVWLLRTEGGRAAAPRQAWRAGGGVGGSRARTHDPPPPPPPSARRGYLGGVGGLRPPTPSPLAPAVSRPLRAWVLPARSPTRAGVAATRESAIAASACVCPWRAPVPSGLAEGWGCACGCSRPRSSGEGGREGREQASAITAHLLAHAHSHLLALDTSVR